MEKKEIEGFKTFSCQKNKIKIRKNVGVGEFASYPQPLLIFSQIS